MRLSAITSLNRNLLIELGLKELEMINLTPFPLFEAIC